MSPFVRINQLFAALAVLTIAAPPTGLADEGVSARKIEVAPQPLSTALQDFSDQSGLQVAYVATLAENVNSKGTKGAKTPAAALSQILDNTGLEYQFVNADTVAIGPVVAANDEAADPGNGRTTPRPVMMAQASESRQPTSTASRVESAGETEARTFNMEEIVVTAQKREERALDIPLSLSVLSGDQLEKKGMVRMDDYLRILPGVNSLDMGNSTKRVVFRGVGTDPELERATSSVYFGEIPISASIENDIGNTGNSADLRMVDIDRVEIIKGPQGTLYGASAMGGILRQIPEKPDLNDLTGTFAAGYSGTARLGGGNNSAQAVFNAPLIQDRLAVRAVAYRFFDTGYYANVAASDPQYSAIAAAFGGIARDERRIGDATTTGGRLSMLWQTTDAFSAEFSYITQRERGGRMEAMQGLGEFEQTRLHTVINGEVSSPDRTADIDVANLVLGYELGKLSFQSSSSYVERDWRSNFDYTVFFLAPAGAEEKTPTPARTFTQEFRVSSQLDGPFQFLAGVYYEDIESSVTADYYWTGDPDLNLFDSDPLFHQVANDGELTQTALFGELSYSPVTEITLKAGGRYFDYEKETLTIHEGLFGNGTSNPTSQEDGTTFSASLDYKPIETLMLYARWAQGFRLGAPSDNTVALSALCDANSDGFVDDIGIAPPGQVDSDSLDNYELGAKSVHANGRLLLNAALYRINWVDIPLSIRSSCGAILTLNGGEAKTEGMELEGVARITDDLSIDFSAAYTDAKLAGDAPSLGNAGDRLPGTPEYKFSVGLEQGFRINRYDAFARADYAYISDFTNSIVPDLDASDLIAGDYSQVNVRAGISLDKLSAEVYADNLLNEVAYTWIGLRYPQTAYFLRPRTIGLSLKYRFE